MNHNSKTMNRGKDICKELKAVRKRIAEENDIVLEIPECTYKGPCKGTCPRCESEVRFLESELAKRIKLGKVAKVAGLALTLGAAGTATAQVAPNNKGIMLDTVNIEADKVPTIEVYDMPGAIVITQDSHVKLTGVVRDSETKEVMPFVNVLVCQDGKPVYAGTTDFDGKFIIDVLPGVYDVEIRGVGYMKYIQIGVTVREGQTSVEMGDILLKSTGEPLLDEILIEGGSSPMIEPGTPGQDSKMEIDGLLLRIQY